MTTSPARKPSRLSASLARSATRATALAGLIVGSLFALTGPAAAQDVSLSITTDRYDDNRRYGGPTSRTVNCESEDRRYERCRVDGTISRVYLQHRKSDAGCIQGRDWGYERNAVWVRNGCRGVFNVVYAGGNSYGYKDRDYRDRDYRGRDYRDRDYRDRDYRGRDDRGRDDRGRDYRGGYGRNDRELAINACRSEIQQSLRRAGFRSVDYEGVSSVRPDRDGRGWNVVLAFEVDGRRGDYERNYACNYSNGRVFLANVQDDRYRRY